MAGKIIICALAFIALSVPAFAGAKVKTIEQIPQPLEQLLVNGTYYEDYIAQVLQIIRRQGSQDFISKASIEKIEKQQLAAIRANNVQQILLADADGNGIVTEQEMDELEGMNRAHRQLDFFAQFDSNKDGKITYQEMLAYKPQNQFLGGNLDLEALLVLDADGDGKVTVDELRAGAAHSFALVDIDNNKILSDDEKRALQEVQRNAAIPRVVLEKVALQKATELHAVGVYEGAVGTSAQPHGPVVNIKLDRPGKSVALILTSYEAVKWMITSTPKTRVDKILYRKETRPASEVMLNGTVYREAKPYALGYAYQSKGAPFRQFLETISQITDRNKLEGFHGSYHASEEGFVINSVLPDEELKKDYLVVADAKDLPAIRYRATINNVPGEYSLSGKLIEKLSPDVATAAYNEKAKHYYALADNGFFILDKDGKQLEEITASLDVPVFSWATDISYDPKTNEVVISSLGGEGYLYKYQIAKKKWSAVSLNNQDYSSIEYDAFSDQYVVGGAMGDMSISYLSRDGKIENQEKLDIKKFAGFADIYDPGNDHPNLSIVPHGQYLIIMVSTGHEVKNPGRIYVYDRKSKKAVLTYAKKADQF